MKSIPLFVGLFAEGTTDLRFLEPIVEKTLNDIALNESNQTIDISIYPIRIEKSGEPFGTNKTDNELGISRNPESISNPKEVIENAIRLSIQIANRRRGRKLSISELYSVIGNSINLHELDRLNSYQDFKENARNVFRKMNLI